MITLYNTLTRQKEIFKPLEANKIKLYVCGLTVYDHSHIGHGRTAVAFDVIVRYFRFRGFEVTFVRNITDVDDKIIKRANENNEPIDQLVNRFIASMHHDFNVLGNLKPDIEPRATACIDGMIKMIQRLIDSGFAYATPKGDVYFKVNAFPDYGKLSRQNVEQLRSGVRISPEENKQDVLDFALWKSAKPNEPTWDSPWGPGRPGWHIECSMMSQHYLGDTFDIHGGGSDLIFPHHENEIAQSEAATHKTFANYWLHSGMIRINQQKMSKSLNNFFTIQDVLTQQSWEVVRYFLLSGHYRSEIDYSLESLQQAKSSLERLYTALRDLNITSAPTQNTYTERFTKAMDDDFNAPEALAVLFDLARDINRLKSTNELAKANEHGAILKSLGAVFNILQQHPESFLRGDHEDTSIIENLIQQRNAARTAKNWAESDRIRKQLTEMGIVLEDTNTGTSWRKM